MNVNVKLVQ